MADLSKIIGPEAHGAWSMRVRGGLSTLDPTLEKRFVDISTYVPWPGMLQRHRGLLEGVLLDLTVQAPTVSKPADSKAVAPAIRPPVFIVHGRDQSAKDGLARFVATLGLEPIILHEQASGSKTIIEKLEAFANVVFAIVLLTPDDVGGLQDTPADQRPRARQNVILELGFFVGRLGRGRVCALFKEGLELPSDYDGVVYIDFDAHGAWRPKLAQELVHAGLAIDLAGLVKF